jgi:hypothetical protein
VGSNSYNGFAWRQRKRAYDWLKRQWKAGRRATPTTCDVCRQTRGYLMAHSEDYSFPYGDHIGRWSLCYWCHMLLHCRAAAPHVFARYVTMLEGGERFVNPARAHWRAVQLYLHADRSRRTKRLNRRSRTRSGRSSRRATRRCGASDSPSRRPGAANCRSRSVGAEATSCYRV